MNHPRLWAATDALCWVARDILRKRQQGYPAAVEAGQLTRDAAAAGLRIAASIAADWTRAIELSPHFADFALQPLPEPLDERATSTQAERHKTLSDVLRHPSVKSDPPYAEIVEALLWWESANDRGELTIAQLNRVNAAFRSARSPARLAA
jgi:hypothetical protein